MKLKNKVAIVTGSSRGLGKAIALGFAREGADLVIAARTEIENEQLPGTIHKTAEEVIALGRKALPIKCDVTSEESVASLVDQTMATFGHIDILVNNSGVAFSYPALDTPLKRWELVIKVNISGAFICSKAVLPHMIAQGSGSIVNISSLAGEERGGGPVSTGLAYGVAKAGLDRFTFGLAAEVGCYNIAVNALKPKGVVSTEGMRFVGRDEDQSNWKTPETMVQSCILLAAQDASGITGTVSTDEELYAWHGLS